MRKFPRKIFSSNANKFHKQKVVFGKKFDGTNMNTHSNWKSKTCYFAPKIFVEIGFRVENKSLSFQMNKEKKIEEDILWCSNKNWTQWDRRRFWMVLFRKNVYGWTQQKKKKKDDKNRISQSILSTMLFRCNGKKLIYVKVWISSLFNQA